jgi:hypothetical protein
MAIRVLLDHNVPEDKIALLSLLVSQQGVQTIAYAFPKVKIVTTACDTQLDQKTGFICPGLGNFGDRYFGTDLSSYLDDAMITTNENLNFQACSSHSPSPDAKNQLYNHDDNLSPSVVMKSFDNENVFNGV